jgi:deoxycytidylate deaminase
MTIRIPSDWYFLKMANLASERATCKRRKVGCILVNSKKHVIATGYNGVAAGQEHCIDNPCEGAQLKSGEGLDKCEAIHAEQNALLQCKMYMIYKQFIVHLVLYTLFKIIIKYFCTTNSIYGKICRFRQTRRFLVKK